MRVGKDGVRRMWCRNYVDIQKQEIGSDKRKLVRYEA